MDSVESRRNAIAALINERGEITFAQLKEAFPNVSDMTLRPDLKHLDENCLYSEIDKALDKVFSFKPQPNNFAKTDKFIEMFGDLDPSDNEKSYPVTNIDSNFDNFLTDGDKIWCIDYEWVADFPVPIRFIKYRTLLYFYTKNSELLGNSMPVDRFLEHYGFTSDDIELFGAMDDNFQQFVHGKDRKYILTSRYEKENTTLNELIDLSNRLPLELKLKENHIDNLNKINESKNLYGITD